jgi:hypothetical protein
VSKSKHPAPAAIQGPTPEETREVVETHTANHEGALSYDANAEENALLHLRCLTDPGVSAQQRDGWRGIVKQWACVPYDYEDGQTGEIVTLPCLVLISAKNELVRLSNWPAINSWAAIVRAAGVERCRAGIPVVVRRRQSSTAGRSYWSVQIDQEPERPKE